MFTTLNFKKNMTGNRAQQAQAAIARDYFYNQDHFAIRNYLALDLQNTYALEDIPELKYITIDFMVAAFLQKLVNVHNESIVFKFDESVPKTESDKFAELMNEIEYQSFFPDMAYKTRLHNTALAYVRYNQDLDKVFVGNDYNVGNCEVVTWNGYNYEAEIIAYEFPLGDELVWVVWDKLRKQHYFIKGDFKYDYKKRGVIGDKIPIPGNSGIDAPEYWPWQIYRYKKQNEEFWGNGLDAIVELNRVINVLFTVCGDDIVNETLAVWLYNFNPSLAGNKRKDGRIKVGFRNPLWQESKLGQGVDPKIEVARADLFVDDIVKFVETISSMIANMHGIENVLRTELQQNLAGISIRLKNEPLLRQWKEDINIFAAPDRGVIEHVVEVNNYYRDGTRRDYQGNAIPKNYIDPRILEKLVLDYQQPSVVTDETADFELLKEQAKAGLASLVNKMQSMNPEMSKDEALQKLKYNLAEWDDIFGSRLDITVPGDVNADAQTP